MCQSHTMLSFSPNACRSSDEAFLLQAALSKSMIKSPIMLPAALLVIFLGINALILKKLHGRGKVGLDFYEHLCTCV